MLDFVDKYRSLFRRLAVISRQIGHDGNAEGTLFIAFPPHKRFSAAKFNVCAIDTSRPPLGETQSCTVHHCLYRSVVPPAESSVSICILWHISIGKQRRKIPSRVFPLLDAQKVIAKPTQRQACDPVLPFIACRV